MSRLMFNDIVTISSLSCWMLHSCAPRDGLTSLFAQSIKQHIKRCFWYLGDEEEQSCTLWSIFHKSAFYHKPSVYFRLPCFSVMWLQVCNSCAKYFSDFLSSRDHLRGRSHELFQSEYAFFHINALLVMEKTSATTYFVIVFVHKINTNFHTLLRITISFVPDYNWVLRIRPVFRPVQIKTENILFFPFARSSRFYYDNHVICISIRQWE